MVNVDESRPRGDKSPELEEDAEEPDHVAEVNLYMSVDWSGYRILY